MDTTKTFDVIIIGGSYAGLSAAMALGRSLRNVLIIDGGRPCNIQTPHSHNFLTQDGVEPAIIAQRGREQVLAYSTVNMISDLAVEGKRIKDGFQITTSTGKKFNAHRLLFATGVKDLLPDIPGFSDCWGISVIHCPYCHGYEFNGKKTGIMAYGEKAMHLASLINNLTDDLTILTQGNDDFNDEQTSQLKKHDIKVVTSPISEIVHENGQIKYIVLDDGNQLKFDAVYAAVPFEQHSNTPASLGCEITEGGYLQVDDFQKTTVEGVFACGDNSTWMRSVAVAVASGNFAVAVINKELLNARF